MKFSDRNDSLLVAVAAISLALLKIEGLRTLKYECSFAGHAGLWTVQTSFVRQSQL